MNKPKILLLDIETAPNVILAWGVYEQNALKLVRPWYILCFAYKWIGEKTQVKSLPDYSLYKKDRENDKSLVEDLHKLLDEADIVIAHNGDMFDLKKINARMIYHGLTPPSPYKTIDTLKIARQSFSFTSNRLNDLGVFLSLGEKLETGGFKLWEGCMAGDMQSWKKMTSYNANDVILLEKVYLKLRAWPKTHPNMGVFTEKIVCSHCGSRETQSRGFAFQKTLKYKRFQCMSCGGWSRDFKNVKKEKPLVSA